MPCINYELYNVIEYRAAVDSTDSDSIDSDSTDSDSTDATSNDKGES